MKIISHGEWEVYTPSEHPPSLPKNIIFARRKSDMTDWYEYIYPKDKEAPHPFGADTIKCATSWQEVLNAHIVGPVTKDVTMIFPSNRIVLEISGYDGDEADAFAEFNGKAYDPATDKFSKAEPVSKAMSLMARIEELERRLK